jgi:carboxylesterase
MPNYLPGAEPFYFPGNRVGCLLIHGFTGTPYEMRGLGEHLAAEGYTVLGPALAGHATYPEAMLPTRWYDWYGTVTAAYEQLTTQCDAIFPIGLSLGGTLVLHLAAHRPVTGVVAVSTPFTVENRLISFFKRFPFLLNFVPSIRKNPNDNDTEDHTIRAHHPEYPINYTRPAASVILELLPHLHNDLRDIHVPVLLLQARRDRVIPPNSMETYFARIASTDKEMVWLDRGGHLALEDYAKEIAFAHILDFIRTHIAQRKI